jgi:hypothetical protein
MKSFKLHPSAIDPIRTGLALGALIGMAFELVDAGCFRPGAAFHRLRLLDAFPKTTLCRTAVQFRHGSCPLVVTLSLGFVIGSIFAVLWNWIHKH